MDLYHPTTRPLRPQRDRATLATGYRPNALPQHCASYHRIPALQLSSQHQRFRALQASSRDSIDKIATLSGDDPFDILDISPTSSKKEIRTAYLNKMREIHPDVNPERDTTDEAVAVNEAYEVLMSQDIESLQLVEDTVEELDVFETLTSPPIYVFVNPFQCYVDFFNWRQLQAAASLQTIRGQLAAKRYPQRFVNVMEQARKNLSDMGVTFDTGALQMVTKEQLDELTQELEQCELNNSQEVAEYYIFDCLATAYRTNRGFAPVEQRM